MISYRGKVQGKVVVLEEGITLPEGTPVLITEAAQPAPKRTEGGTWLDRLDAALAQTPEPPPSVPNDLAENHDHYLHGQPRK